MTIHGVLLTGGASRRLGTDKAALLYHGESLAVHAARVLAAVCAEAVEVGLGVSGLPSVREEPAGAGPLAALLAGVAALSDCDGVLLFGCDYPRVDHALLQLIADDARPTAVPIVDGRAQYVCAKYGRDAIAAARAAFEHGERGFRWLSEFGRIEPDVWRAVAPSDAWRDIDTPDDAAELGIELLP